MSIGTQQGEPMASEDSFDRDWAAAKVGTYTGSTSQSNAEGGTEAPVTPAPPVTAEPDRLAPPPASAPVVAAREPSPTPPPQPTAPTYSLDPALLQQFPAEMRTPEAIARAARQFLSIQGQLPNLEQKWRQQYVAPIEQERDRLLTERRQALEQLATIDPNTNRPRTPQDEAYIRQQIAAAEALEAQKATTAQQQQQDRAAVQQAQAVLQQREQEVQAQGVGALRLTALNALPLWKAQVVQEYGVPLAELDAYTAKFNYEERIKGFGEDDMRQVGPMLEALQNYAVMRQEQLQGEQARLANAGQRYRDLGSPAGAGGQSSGDRWTKANDDDFTKAWERAKRGELV